HLLRHRLCDFAWLQICPDDAVLWITRRMLSHHVQKYRVPLRMDADDRLAVVEIFRLELRNTLKLRVALRVGFERLLFLWSVNLDLRPFFSDPLSRRIQLFFQVLQPLPDCFRVNFKQFRNIFETAMAQLVRLHSRIP
ncbi:hypothetical protein RA280_48160, partial [Cupriavidus sp. CV2]|uniref:hypothetical protein n=1 Tax=Cupriavidus ulmosensis TaxID=3065913 RepID=UPI00296B44B0